MKKRGQSSRYPKSLKGLNPDMMLFVCHRCTSGIHKECGLSPQDRRRICQCTKCGGTKV